MVNCWWEVQDSCAVIMVVMYWSTADASSLVLIPSFDAKIPGTLIFGGAVASELWGLPAGESAAPVNIWKACSDSWWVPLKAPATCGFVSANSLSDNFQKTSPCCLLSYDQTQELDHFSRRNRNIQ